jgi:hypothetical protein
MGLVASKDFGGAEVLKVLVVHDNINRQQSTLKIMLPDMESLKDSQEFFIMSVIVQFRHGKGVRVESNGVDFSIVRVDGENGS